MSDQQTKTTKSPTHEVFHVRGEGDKTYWTKIGAAWKHSKGDGMNVQMELMPIASGRIVIRERKANTSSDKWEG